MRNEEESKSENRLFNASPGYPLFGCHSRGLSHPLHPFSAECCSCQQWDILPCGVDSASPIVELLVLRTVESVFGESTRGQEVQHHMHVSDR